MKKTLFAIVALVTVLTSCDFGAKYKITGTVTNLESEMVYLKEFKDNQAVVIDSAKFVDNTFVFENKFVATKKCYLFTSKDAERPVASLYLEKGETTITLDMNNPKDMIIVGGPAQELAKSFKNIQDSLETLVKPLNEKYMALMPQKEALGAKFEEEINKLREEYDVFSKETQKQVKALIETNLGSVVAADQFASLFNKLEATEAKELVNKFTEEAAKSESITKIKERIAILESVEIGKPAPDFTLPSPDGTPIALSSFKGKLLIVDFWASWCGPCRGENPNVVKMYNTYHEKGLEILSVSLDEKKEDWIAAIEKDGLVWNHVSDLKGWSSSAAKLYGVNSIPHIVLINQEGIIVAKDLRGEELENKLKELIK